MPRVKLREMRKPSTTVPTRLATPAMASNGFWSAGTRQGGTGETFGTVRPTAGPPKFSAAVCASKLPEPKATHGSGLPHGKNADGTQTLFVADKVRRSEWVPLESRQRVNIGRIENKTDPIHARPVGVYPRTRSGRWGGRPTRLLQHPPHRRLAVVVLTRQLRRFASEADELALRWADEHRRLGGRQQHEHLADRLHRR
jgi:hypothetical protein